MERLGHVVVGARVEALDLVLPAVTRGENEDGEAAILGPPATDHLETGQLGQAQVDDRHIDGIFKAREQALLAVGGNVHGEARLGELGRDAGLAQRGFVLDHQCTHGVPSAPVR